MFKMLIDYFRFLNNDILYINGKKLPRDYIIKELIRNSGLEFTREFNVYIPTGSKNRYNSYIKLGKCKRMGTKDLYYALKSNGYII